MRFIHDGNNPGFFFDYTDERFDYMQEEGCNPHIVTPEKAQSIWEQLGYTGSFEIYRGMGRASCVYDREYHEN